MNILPKKKWHVRTKENVERVRRDEEQARLEQEVEQGRIGKAESEARLRLLRSKASEKYGNVNIQQEDGHINLFCEQQNKTGNREAKADADNEQREYEKKVGWLKPLGGGSVELAEDKPWYIGGEVKEKEKKKRSRPPVCDILDVLDPFTEMKKRTKVDYATPRPDTIETVYVDIDFTDKVKDMSDKRRKERQSTSSSKHKKKHHKKHKKSRKQSSSESESEVDIKKLRERQWKGPEQRS